MNTPNTPSPAPSSLQKVQTTPGCSDARRRMETKRILLAAYKGQMVLTDALDAILALPHDDAWEWRPISEAPEGERIWVIQMTPGDYENVQTGGLCHRGGWYCDLVGLWPTHFLRPPPPPPPEGAPR